MQLERKECMHISDVLSQVKQALKEKDALKLKDLSNMTVHDSCNYQDSASITIAVIVYTLSKIVERDDYRKMNNWDLFVKKFNSFLDLAIKALGNDDLGKYQGYVNKARKLIESQSISLKPYIQDVLKKASINKGARIYEHGLSLEQTAKLLGVTQWELSSYIGERTSEAKQFHTINVKERAKMAMEFFE